MTNQKNDGVDYTPDRSKFKDSMGRYLTQSLFLEHGYNTETAVYTLSDEDKEYNGVIYPSLRRLYLLEADPTEYHFACKYLWGWDHWQRIVSNKALYVEIDRWRDELEVKLRAQGVRAIITSGVLGDSFNASKWVADGRWEIKRGRPSKEELEGEREKRAKIAAELESDSSRVYDFVRKRKDG